MRTCHAHTAYMHSMHKYTSACIHIMHNLSKVHIIACCRYAGMVAWRGVADGNAHPELLKELKEDFTTLGNGIKFDITDRCMNLIYMIPGNRINWLW